MPAQVQEKLSGKDKRDAIARRLAEYRGQTCFVFHCTSETLLECLPQTEHNAAGLGMFGGAQSSRRAIEAAVKRGTPLLLFNRTTSSLCGGLFRARGSASMNIEPKAWTKNRGNNNNNNNNNGNGSNGNSGNHERSRSTPFPVQVRVELVESMEPLRMEMEMANGAQPFKTWSEWIKNMRPVTR
jgi:hypothetical protein